MLRTINSQFALGLRGELRQLAPMISSLVHLSLTLVIFHGLWVASAQGGLELPASPSDMVWYIVITEVVTLSVPSAHREIASEINSGRVTAHLLRPMSFLVALVARYGGVVAFRASLLALVGCCVSFILTGTTPTHSAALIPALVVAPLAAFVLLLFLTAIGLSAPWLRDPIPLYWIFSKLAFVFGGLLVPISLYPEWFQRIASVLPFQAILYGVAGSVLRADMGIGFATIARLLAWGGVALSIAAFLHHAHVRRILREGE